MLAGMSLGTDLKRYSRGTMPRVALLTIIVLPLLYGAMYLWAFWNPFAAIDKIPVALVNSDTGATVEGQQLRAGDEVTRGLVDSGQLDLHEVSEAEAAKGFPTAPITSRSRCRPTSARRWSHRRARTRRRRRSSSGSTTPTTTWHRSWGRTPPARCSTRSAPRSASR